MLAAAALMATSAIGPGFLTQTTVFTEKLLYNFGFVILLSIIIDIVAQVTIWKALTFSNSTIQELADTVLKGLGSLIICFIAFGGLVFNIGNLAGTGMGMNAMFGISQPLGTLISAIIVGFIFYSNNLLPKLDIFIRIMAVAMIILLILMIGMADVDFLKTIKFSFWPEKIDVKATITLVGGTVGGYITFAGAQRLLDAGIVGKDFQSTVEKSAYTGIFFTGLFRYMLYIGVLSVVLIGVALKSDNPVETVFETHFGSWGKVAFGMMIWAASITSVVGATYTSLAFMRDLHPTFFRWKKIWALVFVGISLLVNYAFGRPVTLLVFAGYLNAFVLPIGLFVVLISILRNQKLKGIKISPLILAAGWILMAFLIYFSVSSLFG